MEKITTSKPFERRNSIDGQLHNYIPPGTKLNVIEDDCIEGYYDLR